MRCAWDLQAVTGPNPTGLGYSVQLLLNAYKRFGGADGGAAEILELRPNAQDKGLRGVPDRLAWEQWRLPQAVSALHPPPDLLYSPALGAPLRCAVPRVAHVHDLIPLASPVQFKGMAGWYWTELLPSSWKTCVAITVSNASLVDEVAQRLEYPRKQIHVVPYYACISPEEIASAAAKPNPAHSPYFMTLASHEPRKNIVLALNALAVLAERGLRPMLVCLGTNTQYTRLMRQLAYKLGVGDQVTWPGYAARDTTLDLLKHAAALLFVSKLEGYGMPPQEAQVLGTPVVLSDIPCHHAVYDDAQRWTQVNSELRVPPPFVGIDDEVRLADAMQRLLEDQEWRARLVAAGQAYQATFSANTTGTMLRNVFESIS